MIDLLWYEIISEEERKTYIKRIEFHLRNWKNYKAAVLNLERRMEKEQKNGLTVKERNAEYQIDAEKRLYQFLLDSMETAVSELDELERKLVECRYIHNWSMGKCAMEIGYSEKTLFLMKKSPLDKSACQLGGDHEYLTDARACLKQALLFWPLQFFFRFLTR